MIYIVLQEKESVCHVYGLKDDIPLNSRNKIFSNLYLSQMISHEEITETDVYYGNNRSAIDRWDIAAMNAGRNTVWDIAAMDAGRNTVPEFTILVERTVVAGQFQVVHNSERRRISVLDLRRPAYQIEHLVFDWPQSKDICAVPGEKTFIMVGSGGLKKFSLETRNTVWDNTETSNMGRLTCGNQGRFFVMTGDKTPTITIYVYRAATGW